MSIEIDIDLNKPKHNIRSRLITIDCLRTLPQSSTNETIRFKMAKIAYIKSRIEKTLSSCVSPLSVQFFRFGAVMPTRATL